MKSQNQLTLTVNICLGPNEEVLSNHNFASSEDSEIAKQWSGGGLRQVAHALLTEAVRREAFTSLIVKMSADPEYLQNYLKATPEERKALETEMSVLVQEVLTRNLQKMTLPSTQEAFQMILTQLPSQKKG